MEPKKLHTYLVLALECPWPVAWAVIARMDGTPTHYPVRTEWRLNGKLHRIGEPAVEWADGDKVWWEHGEVHRIGGPAVEWSDGTKEWFEHDKHHRIGGPAVEWANGRNEWWERGHQIAPIADST